MDFIVWPVYVFSVILYILVIIHLSPVGQFHCFLRVVTWFSVVRKHINSIYYHQMVNWDCWNAYRLPLVGFPAGTWSCSAQFACLGSGKMCTVFFFCFRLVVVNTDQVPLYGPLATSCRTLHIIWTTDLTLHIKTNTHRKTNFKGKDTLQENKK